MRIPPARVAVVSLRVLASSFAVTALVLLSSWLFGLSVERAALLAPVLVVGVAAVAGLLVLWGRVGWEQYRESRHPVAIAVAAGAFVALFVTLSILGVRLPHE
jgi:multidrug efflux pump subunit AcrB